MKWTEITTGLKETSQALRELALVVAIGAIVCWPSGVGSYAEKLAKAFHVKEGDFLGWKVDFTDKANITDQAVQSLDKATDQIKSLQASGNLAGSTAETLSSILDQVETSQAQVQKVDETIKQSIAATQPDAPDAAPIALKGWIYLGKLDDHGGGNLTWQQGQPQTIAPVEVKAIVPGKELTIRDDVYLHNPVEPSGASTAPIIGVLRVNTKAVVADKLNLDSRSPDGKVRYAWVLINPK